MTGDEITAMRALAHPMRLRILSLLTGTAMSAAEVARELGLTHANASYHLRLLADADELVVDGGEKIRGGVAKRYRYPHERDLTPPEAGAPARTGAPTGYLRALGKDLERRSRSRVPASQGLSSDLEGWVDEATWEEALELVTRAARLLHERNRPPRTEGTVHVSATTLAFRMHDGGDGADGTGR
ncbi:DNA-binding transcriptional ArsR family regulator [Nocardioides marinisabuli]|uniref:DNA-binding transcriptional ArsR family regulator n=1 Tax=Nocardioides marinisabuli TaxID=419476 RepID=A0A7Y9F2C8_9ACTN|nr:helix-turn-helix domain-containing protein [Nocardioides marinisabuli]NYD58091.1 DNA-binding transcriptional ArsR family regulator [Nocardioides marinisabuli]